MTDINIADSKSVLVKMGGASKTRAQREKEKTGSSGPPSAGRSSHSHSTQTRTSDRSIQRSQVSGRFDGPKDSSAPAPLTTKVDPRLLEMTFEMFEAARTGGNVSTYLLFALSPGFFPFFFPTVSHAIINSPETLLPPSVSRRHSFLLLQAHERA